MFVVNPNTPAQELYDVTMREGDMHNEQTATRILRAKLGRKHVFVIAAPVRFPDQWGKGDPMLAEPTVKVQHNDRHTTTYLSVRCLNGVWTTYGGMYSRAMAANTIAEYAVIDKADMARFMANNVYVSHA